MRLRISIYGQCSAPVCGKRYWVGGISDSSLSVGEEIMSPTSMLKMYVRAGELRPLGLVLMFCASSLVNFRIGMFFDVTKIINYIT